MAVDRQGLIAQAEKYVGDYEAEALIRELVAALSSGDPAARPDGEPREDDGDDIHRSVEYVVTPESKAFERGRKSAVEEIARLRQQLAEMTQQIAEAREECPIVRRQDFFDAPLVTLIREEVSQLFQMQSRAEAAEARCAALTQQLAEMEGIAAEAEVEHQIGHKEDYAQMLDAAEARCAALTQERDRLLADWRDQDQALQRIYGETGREDHVSCPDDVASYAETALQELRSELTQLRAAVELIAQEMDMHAVNAFQVPGPDVVLATQVVRWADRLRRGFQGQGAQP